MLYPPTFIYFCYYLLLPTIPTALPFIYYLLALLTLERSLPFVTYYSNDYLLAEITYFCYVPSVTYCCNLLVLKTRYICYVMYVTDLCNDYLRSLLTFSPFLSIILLTFTCYRFTYFYYHPMRI